VWWAFFCRRFFLVLFRPYCSLCCVVAAVHFCMSICIVQAELCASLSQALCLYIMACGDLAGRCVKRKHVTAQVTVLLM
jgi:hypothetical protein